MSLFGDVQFMDSTKAGFDLSEDSSGFWTIPDTHPELLRANSCYSILEEIGRGGAGVVYRAKDLTLNREVAAKILHSDSLNKPKDIERFTNEAKTMGALQHPGIAHVYECGFTECGRPFHTMKLVEGATLTSILKKLKKDPAFLGYALSIFARVCDAMAYTHSEGVLHLDLKPSNVMVGAFGEVYIMDWGLARSMVSKPGELAKPVRAHGIHGTPHYMAPEQGIGAIVDKRTDVFCLGGILCEILTGRSPYRGKDQRKVIMQVRSAALQPASDALDSCGQDQALVRLAKHCLMPSPNDRPNDASEVAKEVSRQSLSQSEKVEQDMAQFFELSLDLFCIAGFDGYFRRINGNFSRVLGYTEEELLSRPFIDFVVDEDRERTKEVMGQLLNGTPIVRFRNHYRTANGGSIEFEWTSKSVVEENIIFAVARNVSSPSIS